MKYILSMAFLWVVLTGCEQKSTTPNYNIGNDQKLLINRGKYLVDVIGCNDCHSPKVFTEFGPVPDPNRLLSGYPNEAPVPAIDKNQLNNWVLFGMENTMAVGPWGVSFAGNITSDATGIGSWSLDQFKRALRQGKYKGLENARMLLPPMPWTNYKELTDEDIEAIFIYLKSTKPVENVVPLPIPSDQL